MREPDISDEVESPVGETGHVRDHVAETAAAEASRTWFESVVEAIPHMVWVAGAAGENLYNNRKLEAFVGLPGEALRGQGWTQTVHPDDLAKTVTAWQRASAAGREYSGYVRVRRHDGEYRWCVARATPLRDGQVVRWIGTWTELDDQAIAEQHVKRSERVYRAIGEAIDYGVWICAPDGRNIYASDAFLRLVGLTQAECSAFGWGNVLHPDDAERTIAAWKECVRTEGSWDIEHRFRGVDGRWHPVLARGVPVRDEQGEVICWAGINLDISRLKAAEEAAREGQARFSSLASANVIGVLGGDVSRVTFGNEYFLQMVGRTQEELERGELRWSEMTPPEHRAADARAVEALITHGACAPYRKEFLRKDGRRVPILLGASRLTSTPLTWICFALDLTEQNRMENELREVDRRKTEFMAVLSHELRNPLAPIRNAIALLRRAGPLGVQAERALEIVERQTGQLSKLVEDLLDITRVTSGKVRLQKSVVSLAALVRSTLEDHRELFTRGEIALRYQGDTPPIWIEADGARLVQVIGNLLTNAVKFTARGGHVTVALERSGGRAILRVTDDGAGMDRTTLGEIFQPFTQAAATLDRSGGGLGLGLALARTLVELHGGEVRATSAGVGEGSEFEVSLPLAAGPAAPEPTAPRPAARVRRRVLIIEDNEDGAATLRELLELEGHEVVTAHDGQQGLEAAVAGDPEVVLCDIGIPSLDGYELARRLRALGCRARLVALTGYATPQDVERARCAGFDDHLAKPASLDRLFELVAAGPVG